MSTFSSYSRVVFVSLFLISTQACSRGASQADQGAQGGGQGRGGQGRGGRGGGGGPAGVAAKTTPVQRISIQRQVDLSGTLVSPDQVQVSSEVAGVVKEVMVELGSEVRAGQVLLSVEPRELELALERAESALRQTEAQLGVDPEGDGEPLRDDQIAAVRTAAANRDDARAQLSRAQELDKEGLVTKVELNTIETRVKVSEAAYQAALENIRALKASLQDRRASYELAQKKVADASVRAPVGGAIAARLVQRGEFIRENTPVVTIVQVNPLKLRTSVQEKYANVIRPNLPVDFKVESLPDQTFHGKIEFISPSVEEGTRTFPIEISVDNSARQLKPGFFAKGAIFTGTDDNVMAIPDEAVSTLAGVSSVYVIENGVVRQQNVTLGVHQGKSFEILSGLGGSEILAASNLNQLFTGTKITSDSERENVSGNGSPRGDRGGSGGSGGAGRGQQRRGERGGGQ